MMICNSLYQGKDRLFLSIISISIMGLLVFGFGDASSEDLYLNESEILSQNIYLLFQQALNEIDEEDATVSIVLAAWLGWVHPYIYVWNGKEFEIRSAFARGGYKEIPAWSGFWIQAKEDVNFVFNPRILVPPAPETMHLTLDPNKYHLISVPLILDDEDIQANFGSVLGMGQYEQTWRFSKWDYTIDTFIRYEGPGNDFLDLMPGRGFWAYHLHPTPKVLTVNGKAVPMWPRWRVKTPANGDSPAEHMIGNPYHYSIRWWHIFVQKPMDYNLPTGKITGGRIFEDMKSWFIGLELKDPTDTYRDTYNRAGVIESGEDCSELLCATDMAPPGGDYVRITLSDPEVIESIPLAYDYRSPGQDEYLWNIELTTTLDALPVELYLNNLASIPQYYEVTLTDVSSGETFELHDDHTLNLTLTNTTSKTFLLSAVNSAPVSIETMPIPETFSITDVWPNPFNPSTTVSFTLEQPGYMTLTIYNMNGQIVETLIDSYQRVGYHSVVWDATGYSSGIYIVLMEFNGSKDFKKFTLIK